MLPKGRNPEDCEKALFAATQRDSRKFHETIRDDLVDLCEVDSEACFVCDDRTTLRNPKEIEKIIDVLEPYVRNRKRKARIVALRAFHRARQHLFHLYVPKPRLRKHVWA